MEHVIETAGTTYTSYSCDPCIERCGTRSDQRLATRLQIPTLDGPKDLCDECYDAVVCRDCGRILLRTDTWRGGCSCGGRVDRLVAK